MLHGVSPYDRIDGMKTESGKCQECGHKLRCPACDGRKGGKAKVKKGFACERVQAKAQKARGIKA